MNRRFEPAPEIRRYAEVPFARRRWFFVLAYLVFLPAAIALALSGPVYAKRHGEVVRFSRRHLRRTALCFALVLVVNLLHALLPR
jgi:hypothetical protein